MTNTTSHVVHVCDCCEQRVKHRTRNEAERHEKYQSSRTSPAEMGIHPGLGEELRDYLLGFKS